MIIVHKDLILNVIYPDKRYILKYVNIIVIFKKLIHTDKHVLNQSQY